MEDRVLQAVRRLDDARDPVAPLAIGVSGLLEQRRLLRRGIQLALTAVKVSSIAHTAKQSLVLSHPLVSEIAIRPGKPGSFCHPTPPPFGRGSPKGGTTPGLKAEGSAALYFDESG